MVLLTNDRVLRRRRFLNLAWEQLGLEGEHTLRFCSSTRSNDSKHVRLAVSGPLLIETLKSRLSLQIHLGNRRDALLLLQTVAVDLGRVYADRHETIFDAC